MEVKYLSRSTFANICKSLWCCSFQPLLLRSGIHLNFFDRKVVSLLFSDGFCPNGLSVKIQRHRIHQRKTQKNGNKAPFIIILWNKFLMDLRPYSSSPTISEECRRSVTFLYLVMEMKSRVKKNLNKNISRALF